MANVRALALGLSLVAAVASAQTPPSAASTTAPDATLTYRILRGGHELGRQSMVFRDLDGATDVETVSQVQVIIGGKDMYEFTQTMHELWRGQRLVQFKSVTNDNGEHHIVELAPSAGRSLLVADGQHQEVAADIAPTSLWHPFMLKRSALFDTLHGDVHSFKLRDEGEVSLRIADRDVLARYFVLTGGIRRKLWYAPGDQLLRMALTARDGSEVVFEVMR